MQLFNARSRENEATTTSQAFRSKDYQFSTNQQALNKAPDLVINDSDFNSEKSGMVKPKPKRKLRPLRSDHRISYEAKSPKQSQQVNKTESSAKALPVTEFSAAPASGRFSSQALSDEGIEP